MRFVIAANLLGLPAISVPVSVAYLFLRILSHVLYGLCLSGAQLSSLVTTKMREIYFDLHHQLRNLTPTNLDTFGSKIYKNLIRRIKKVKERKN
jgi:hypothetical protein